MLAISNKNIEVAFALIKHGANIDLGNKEGYTSLLIAILRNEDKLTLELIKRNADLEAKSNDGINALILAAYSGKETIIKALIDKVDLNAVDKNNQSALYAAISKVNFLFIYLLYFIYLIFHLSFLIS
jgi:ankyrin repeat protein